MDAYTLTEQQIEKINHLNHLLRKEQQWLLNFIRKTKELLSMNKHFDDTNDYSFQFVLKVFSDNLDCNQRNKVDQGKPIYMMRRNLSVKETASFFLTDDWNSNYLAIQSHVFSTFHFCYSMHCIAFHSGLSMEDILLIDSVRMDVKVDFQLRIETNRMKTE